MLTWLLVLLFGFSSQNTATLSITVSDLKQAKGSLQIAVYGPEGKFGEGKPEFFAVVPVKNTQPHQTTLQVPPGRYAVAIYQDVNGNGELDKKWTGIPSEPYGFSNNFRPRFSGPTFQDCVFEAGANRATSLQIRLLH